VIFGDDPADTKLLRGMADDARKYLEGHRWCARVTDLEFGDGVGGIVAVFLATIVAAQPGVDERLWVIVGDVPPLYLVTNELPTPRRALESYVAWRREWVDAVTGGGSMEGLPPVNAAPTAANADALSVRLDLIEKMLEEWA
jgi:hypothetical protein